MSNEKTSEGADWRSRLNQLEALPGTDGTWREGAWEKLHARLREKEERPRRRMGWYWAAAACLAIVVASLLPGKTEQPARPGQPGTTAASGQPGGTSESGQHGPTVESGQPGPTPESGQPARAAESGKNLSSAGPIAAGRVPSSERTIHPKAQAEPDQLRERPVVVAAATAQPAVFPDTTVLASTAPPIAPAPQRRLRVVHINELGMPVREDSPSSHMAGNFFLRIRLFNNDAPTNLMMGSNNEINLNQSFKISFKN